MKKFSELNKVNESIYVHREEEVELLLGILGVSIEDIEDIFINFLDKGDHDFGINLQYIKYNPYGDRSRYTTVYKKEINKDIIKEIELVVYFQSNNYTEKKGYYSKNEINLIEEYILSIKKLSSIIKTDKLSFNTILEQLSITITFDVTDEIIDGLRKVILF